ncbi:hypothetical protein DPEC_G00350370 [Dallia pectoralis]|uniref:Uncharacterized protein n=1 Tax=Dallia pectoralis TaxID=75939 RepID=A0ACC2F1P7_DALPE|nr:hypothetical protein DPEC_G00350370 [Dallia pectoralis]
MCFSGATPLFSSPPFAPPLPLACGRSQNRSLAVALCRLSDSKSPPASPSRTRSRCPLIAKPRTLSPIYGSSECGGTAPGKQPRRPTSREGGKRELDDKRSAPSAHPECPSTDHCLLCRGSARRRCQPAFMPLPNKHSALFVLDPGNLS